MTYVDDAPLNPKIYQQSVARLSNLSHLYRGVRVIFAGTNRLEVDNVIGILCQRWLLEASAVSY